jgi:Cu-Zn family superoxide dismutase
MREDSSGTIFTEILYQQPPRATAWIRGNKDNPHLSGCVRFYDTPYDGILIEAEVTGLPNMYQPGNSSYYAMHIHENGDCTPPFDQTGGHYSRKPAPHPLHSGDMIPLLGNQGYAWTTFYDSRVTIAEIEGRSVIIHGQPDDFTTQPSGNAGEKIGCGIIVRTDDSAK